ncbi:acetyltransferase (plasmid) [Rhodococcus pyridinivorans]|uniref:Lysine N-acyltransferase MbtK n=2 Tax=Rhodococcus pyridinivorans TaxID=103816 RepID=A0A7M2XXI6_9NOCA|nr:acetyltransferase [Rhodococcus pyridinivorans]
MVSSPPLPMLRSPWSLRAVRAEGTDLDLVHGWMQQPHVEAFWHQAWSRDRWANEISEQLAGEHSLPVLVSYENSPLAYAELYRVQRDRIAEYYAYGPYDLGIHIAIGEQKRTGQGLGTQMLRVLAEGMLDADPGCRRVVAEPDVLNEVSIKAFHAAGFRPAGEVILPDKTAALVVHPRTEEDML